MVKDVGALIVETAGVCGGRPRIAGTGVSVRRVAGWYKMGRSPEEMADRYGHLNLAQVEAALAYHHANRCETDAQVGDEEPQYERLAASCGGAPVGSATVQWRHLTPNRAPVTFLCGT